MNLLPDGSLSRYRFSQTSKTTLVCELVPLGSGLYSFRVEFSLDNGENWLRDTVPDSWILIDPAQTDALRLYTYIPTISGQIDNWTADLARIRDLGFNAVHLLPITPLGASESPYAAVDLFGIEDSYMVEASGGSIIQFESYVATARSMNIRLCFDLVLNHVALDSEIARCSPDWITPDQDQPDGLRRARYWSGQTWENWNDLVLINYEHPSHEIRAEIWSYMKSYALFWARYADETGGFVRFDNLHSSNPEFISEVARVLHCAFPEVAIIAEYFTDESTLLHYGPKWGLNLVLATPWSYRFVPQLREYLAYIHGISEHIRYHMPITSHDSGSPAQEFGTANSTVPRYVAAALLGTGSTGITEGVEYGEAERIDFIGRKPRRSYPKVARFGQFLAQVNVILSQNKAFRRGGNCEFVDRGHQAILAAFRKDDSGTTLGFLVVCNFDTQRSQRIEVDWAAILPTGEEFDCTDLVSGNPKFGLDPSSELVLPLCTAQVLRIDYRKKRSV